jgi:phage repressor protein C with HTH and peptisase S24 domain
MPNIVTERFIACHDKLKEEQKIRSSRQFALSLDYLPQNLNEILKGKRNVPLELIYKAINEFDINPVFLFTGDGLMFLEKDNPHSFRVLTVVTDQTGNEKIVHIPVPAQAGYAGEGIDPVFISELPAYTLPDISSSHGTFRSFDICGDSMEPILKEGEKVVCSFVEPDHWITGIRDRNVYVIVTRSSLLVKRVINNLQKHRHLELLSDNNRFKPFRVNVGEIREIWYVRKRISPFSHSENQPGQPNHNSILEQIDQQTALIGQLQQTINQMIEEK